MNGLRTEAPLRRTRWRCERAKADLEAWRRGRAVGSATSLGRARAASESVVVASSPDGVAHRPRQPQHHADQKEGYTDGPENRDMNQESDDEKDDSKNDHDDGLP